MHAPYFIFWKICIQIAKDEMLSGSSY